MTDARSHRRALPSTGSRRGRRTSTSGDESAAYAKWINKRLGAIGSPHTVGDGAPVLVEDLRDGVVLAVLLEVRRRVARLKGKRVRWSW